MDMKYFGALKKGVVLRGKKGVLPKLYKGKGEGRNYNYSARERRNCSDEVILEMQLYEIYVDVSELLTGSFQG